MKMESSLLIDKPKTYAHWWTFVPVIPASRHDHGYSALKRQWFDHTMNCLSGGPGDWKLKSSRGFYVQGHEDHIAPVLFHIWASFPDAAWVGPLLDLWDIAHGVVRRVQWSYSWEQRTNGKNPITDIVLCWEDSDGQAVVVIEAKRPGGVLSAKDLDGGARYLDMPSIRPYERKSAVYLVDKADVERTKAAIPGTPVTSWQDMGRLQAGLMLRTASRGHAGHLQACVAKHYADLGMPFDQALADLLADTDFTGERRRYDAVFRLGLADPLERFLIGGEVTFCARSGRMPEPPFAWLADEPSFLEVWAARSSAQRQTTDERAKPLWRLPPTG
jgi:hypothetical protein